MRTLPLTNFQSVKTGFRADDFQILKTVNELSVGGFAEGLRKIIFGVVKLFPHTPIFLFIYVQFCPRNIYA